MVLTIKIPDRQMVGVREMTAMMVVIVIEMTEVTMVVISMVTVAIR